MREKREIKGESKKIRNKFIFGACIVISGAAAMLGINALPVMAAENVGEKMAIGENVDAGADDVGKLSEDSQIGDMTGNEDLGVYDFKDNKTTGTVTVIKEWSDKRTNRERPEPEIKISAKKPNKSTLGYTITFHGNEKDGLAFADGSYVNEIVYNSSGEIVSGNFKIPGEKGLIAGWYIDAEYSKKVEINEDGLPINGLNNDLDLYAASYKTFEIKGYNDTKNKNMFSQLIPNDVTYVIFTDEIKPQNASAIDVDADGDGGVVAWTESNGTIMKISTQRKGLKVQAAQNSNGMFYNHPYIKILDLKNLDTTKVTDMSNMFDGCSGLTSLDLTPLNTQNVTNMSYMFNECHNLINLDLTPLDTHNVTNMTYIFSNCYKLTTLDLTPLNTSSVTDIYGMFDGCSGLTSLDLTPLDTTNVSFSMANMFHNCSSLTSLDLTPLNTSNVQYTNAMFSGCSGLTSLDLTPLDTSNVTNMSYMFFDCSGLTSLDLTPLDTSNVTIMNEMFDGCSSLTNLDLTPLDTANVTNMYGMFDDCYRLTTLKTGITFKFAGTNYRIPGTWQNTAGETFTSGSFPSNVADTYTKIS